MKKSWRKTLAFLLAFTLVVSMTAINAYAAQTSVTIEKSDWGWDQSFTKNGVTVTASAIDPNDGNLMEGGTFTSSIGNFTKIEVTTMSAYDVSGTGWSVNGGNATWTGDASSVSFSGSFMGMGSVDTKIVCTIGTAHTHSFTYSATGNTISATCTADGCDLTDKKATLSIVAPTLTTYGQTGDGISASATLTGLSDFNTATGKTIAATDITYVGRGTTTYAESGTAPTEAGTYTAKITVEEKTATVDYEIAGAATTITAVPAASAITYGQTLADSTLTGGTASVDGSFAWKDSTIAPAVSDSEETEYEVTFTPTDTNYAASTCTVKLTVNKAAPTVTAPTAKTLTYNGSEQELVTAGEATGGTMYYALGTDATTAPDASAYTTSIPTATDAGT